jgi:recombination protein RecA
MGVNDKIIEKAGAFFSYNGERLGQGRDNVKTHLSENFAVAGEIEAKIKAKFLGENEKKDAGKVECIKEKSSKFAKK